MHIEDVINLVKNGVNISIDSRLICEGNIFFAINNGVNFVEEAFKKGAVLAVVPHDKGVSNQGNLVFVNNTLESLLEIGRKIRLGSKAKIVGITGSAGKTTTKVWLAEILSKYNNVAVGIKNYNTIYGLPVCLSKLKPNDEYGIFEMGSNNSGEIRELSEYLEPEIGVITNILDSHIGRFGSKAAIAQEKISIIEGIKNGGFLVFNGDSEYKEAILDKARLRGIKTVSFGYDKSNDFCVEDYTSYFGAFRSHYDLLKICIVAIVDIIGEEISNYYEYLHDLKPLVGRGEISKYSHKNKIFDMLDDSYNASPSSMLASLQLLSKLNKYRRKIVVIGEMGELGEFSLQYHQQVADYVDSLGFDKVFFIGSEKASQPFAEKDIEVFSQLDEICMEKILSFVENDAVMLLKGSRSVGLDRILNVLQHIV